jgi:hypothetical protein
LQAQAAGVVDGTEFENRYQDFFLLRPADPIRG